MRDAEPEGERESGGGASLPPAGNQMVEWLPYGIGETPFSPVPRGQQGIKVNALWAAIQEHVSNPALHR